MLQASEVPSLGKEGWMRPVIKRREASLAGRRRGGSFNHRLLLELERTTPSAPFKGKGPLFDGAATPAFPRRGLRLLATFRQHRRKAVVVRQVYYCPPLPL